jgi:tetratricopeptide (TPR) repeat protein
MTPHSECVGLNDACAFHPLRCGSAASAGRDVMMAIMVSSRMRALGAVSIMFCAFLFAFAGVLPPIPVLDLNHFLPAIRQQVQQAYAAARERPQDATASGRLGMVLDAYQEYDAAAVMYERAHDLAPRSFRWLYYLASVEFRQGRFDRSMPLLRQALQLRPRYLAARLKLAEALLAAGKFDESAAMYEAFVKDHSDSVEAYYGLGRSLVAGGHTAQAIVALSKACELYPSYGAAQYALALAYRKLGEPQKAEPHFLLYSANRVGAPPPDDPLMAEVRSLNIGVESHLDRGIALADAGKLQEAIAEHEAALKINPQDVQVHINLIQLYFRAGEIEKAEREYRTAVSLNPNRADAYYNYGVLLLQQHRNSEAETAFRRTVWIDPLYAEAHDNLGYLLAERGDTEGAIEEFGSALRSRPDFRLARYHLATIMVRQRHYSDAIQQLLKTLTPEDDHTPGYLYALAIAYGRNGDYPSAVKYARLARDGAASRHQMQLLASIENDLRTLEHLQKAGGQ